MSLSRSRFPWLTRIVQRRLAVAVLVGQMGIAVTGALVRVTESGLGCSTWPECVPGSLVPVADPVTGLAHELIEFGNRTLGGLLGIVSALCVIAALIVRPFRRRVLILALTMPLGVVAQAVIGGITVRTGLQWWTVATHFLVSMPLIWLAVLLVNAIDDGDARPRPLLPLSLIRLQIAQAGVLGAVLLAGTLVTSAGPHAGDAHTPRLVIPVPTLAQAHADIVFLFVGMVVALGFGLRIGKAGTLVWRYYRVLVCCVAGQGVVGMVQYFTGVPAILVLVHVLGSTAVVAATAGLWAASWSREPLPESAELPASDVEEPVSA